MEVNQITIGRLKEKYAVVREELDKYFKNHPEKKELFYNNFHIRPTTSYWRVVCVNPHFRFAMRTIKVTKKSEFSEAIYKALTLLGDMKNIEDETKEDINNNYGFNVYEVQKRKTQTEFVIQAKFIQWMKKDNYNLLTTEFNIKSGGRQRIDIVAEKDGDLWLIEVKDGDIITDAIQQVLDYKKLIEGNKECVFDLLTNFSKNIKRIDSIKTGIVYTKGEKESDKIDKLWKYKGEEMFSEENCI